MLLEQTVKALPRGRKKEQLFLNLRGEMIQLQNLAEPGSADMPGRGKLPVTRTAPCESKPSRWDCQRSSSPAVRSKPPHARPHLPSGVRITLPPPNNRSHSAVASVYQQRAMMVRFHEDAQVARLLAYMTGMVDQRYSRHTNQ